MSSRSTDAEQVVDDTELVRDLGATEHDDVGPLRVVGQPAQDRDLGEHESACGVRQPQRHVVDARVLAVHGAEPVADVHLGEAGELVGERAALVVVLGRLTLVEAQVLEQRDLSVGESVDRRAGAVAHRVGRERDVAAEHLAQPGGDRRERVRRVGCAFGSAEVRADDDARAAVGEIGQRGRAGPDATVVADRVAVERDVEVRPDEDPAAAQRPEVVDCLHRALTVTGSGRPGRRGRRDGRSSPTRCRTSR